ncbi:hypothetical protein [Lysobacter gummosus]|uniref:Uncharacterized protein n=1 Tax=Lysobacter gummosus TaxID=262324 RepID=A0ABY3XBE6_9GAMM|nr:hypothetical protein [Lysobacter gummosus]UNP29290.1 hypothetical protein MOV92_22940 [Lysobacter gummosus]
MNIKYYKHWADSDLGEGTAYMEVADDLVVRQVEIYGPTIVWSDRVGQSDDRFVIADQPVSSLDLGPEHEIEPSEFAEVWRKATTGINL